MVFSLFLASLSGSLTGLSFNSPRLSFLVWFSFVPFIYLISKARVKQGLLAGFLFGLAFFGVTIFWVARVSRLGFILLLFYLSLYPLLFFLPARFFLKKPLREFTLPALWVIIEFLKEHLLSGFGWTNLGYSQFRNTYLIQAVDLLGTKFISFLIVAANLLIYEIFFSPPSPFFRKVFLARKKIALFSFVLGACFFYSFLRLKGLGEDRFLKIRLVQPNIPQELKWQKQMQLPITRRLKLLAAAAGKDSLVIFPEAAWPFILDGNSEKLKNFSRRIKRDILIGGVKKENGKFYNAALLLAKDGREFASYYKIKLVPFGEYVPFREHLRFVGAINSIGDMSPGGEDKIFSYKGNKFSVLICFEDLFPLFVSRFSRGKDFLVNITNDAWFGGEPEATQHLGIMVMRAIENRISIVRCANTGVSGWVSFKGEINKLTDNQGREVFFAAARTFNISLSRRRSFYNRHPEIFTLLCALFLGAAICIVRVPS